MDIPKHLIRDISLNRDLNWVIKSYRIYRKLETSDKDLVDRIPFKDGYLIRDYTLMLYAKTHKQLPLKKCWELARVKREVIREKLRDIQQKYSNFGIKDPKHRVQALRFHGFIPFKEAQKRLLREGYAYIASNTLIQGELYIYPKRLYDDIKYKNKADQYWQTVFEDLILPGMVRIYYSFEYKSLKRQAHGY